MQVEHGVHLRVLDLLPDLRADGLDFFLGISEMAGEEGESEAFKTFHDLQVVPGADLFLRTLITHVNIDSSFRMVAEEN